MTTCTTRAAAGAAYQDAAHAYFNAWVELAAHDHAENASSWGGVFSAQPEIAPHAEFLQIPPGNVYALMMTRHAQIEAARAPAKDSVGGPTGSAPAPINP